MPPLALSLGICSLPFFFYKSKLKVTWGQCGRKVLRLGRNMQYFSSFLLGPSEDDVGELQGILGEGADVCK